MQRRAFLKLLGLAGVGSTMPLQALAGVLDAAALRSNPAVAYDSRLYTAGGAGRILVSADRGRTWKVHANFGPTCAVRYLAVTGGRLMAAASYQGTGFPLYLGIDRQKWHTA
jgi:hypothetical protein